jgi:hypothetical protein
VSEIDEIRAGQWDDKFKAKVAGPSAQDLEEHFPNTGVVVGEVEMEENLSSTIDGSKVLQGQESGPKSADHSLMKSSTSSDVMDAPQTSLPQDERYQEKELLDQTSSFATETFVDNVLDTDDVASSPSTRRRDSKCWISA